MLVIHEYDIWGKDTQDLSNNARAETDFCFWERMLYLCSLADVIHIDIHRHLVTFLLQYYAYPDLRTKAVDNRQLKYAERCWSVVCV